MYFSSTWENIKIKPYDVLNKINYDHNTQNSEMQPEDRSEKTDFAANEENSIDVTDVTSQVAITAGEIQADNIPGEYNNVEEVENLPAYESNLTNTSNTKNIGEQRSVAHNSEMQRNEKEAPHVSLPIDDNSVINKVTAVRKKKHQPVSRKKKKEPYMVRNLRCSFGVTEKEHQEMLLNSNNKMS